MRVGSVCHRIVDAQLIWRESGTAYRPEDIQEKDRYPTCSIMVWAGIMINGRTRLHVVANGTMTGQRYIDEVLLPHVRLFRGAVGDKFVFMDDNATCHRTLAVQDCLDSEGIQRLASCWSKLSSDKQEHPHRALTEEWDKLPQQLLDNFCAKTVANYILWRFVYNRVSNLDKRFLAKQQEYYSALYGTQAISPRWKTCTVYVNKNMGMAVGSLFVKRHFNEKSKETAEEMIKDIKTAFLELLDEVDWMDKETREAARQKAVLMSEKIGFPEYLMDPQALDEEFEGIEFKPDTYFENVLLNLKHYSRKEQLKLRTPVDRMQWVTSPAVVNAFYTRSKNFITFPAGILQPPLYHQNYIRSLNYGGIGVVIGHEITHGFDDKDTKTDETQCAFDRCGLDVSVVNFL
ncbi:neprilysin-4 [Trichonephila clavipes]|nr:neprilysin-4 [Trichonephila clavipes]